MDRVMLKNVDASAVVDCAAVMAKLVGKRCTISTSVSSCISIHTSSTTGGLGSGKVVHACEAFMLLHARVMHSSLGETPWPKHSHNQDLLYER